MSKHSFFDLQDFEVYRGDDKPSPRQLRCSDCDLFRFCDSPKIKTWGNGRKRIMLVGEAPGKNEDIQGVPFVGKTGRLLRKTLESFGLIVERDVWLTHAVRCRPQGNATPTPVQIEACRRFLIKDIKRLKPNVVITVGETAFTALTSHKMSGRAATSGYVSWIGEQIPDQEYGVWVCPVYHPSHIIELAGDVPDPQTSATMKLWTESIQQALALKSVSVPNHIKLEDAIEILHEPRSVIDALNSWKGDAMFDYETTGLKPHREEQRILCVSVSNRQRTISFPFFDDTDFREAWKQFLTNPDIGKMAHNISFESLWSKHVCGVEVGPWIDDTLLLAHCANNRKPTNEKFLIYAHLGIVGYDSIADQFIQSKGKEKENHGANGLNRMKDMPLNEILVYCAKDSLYGYVLRDELLPLLQEHQIEGYDFFVAGQAALAKVQQYGIGAHGSAFQEERLKVAQKIVEARQAIHACAEMKRWDEDEEFSPTKSTHLKKLLFDKVGITPTAMTKNGNVSLDVSALEDMDTEFTRAILTYRKWDKALTYIKQFERETVNDKIYASFNLGTARTYRSSISNPSMQNVPTRDEEIKGVVRGLITPTPGNFLVGYDYKGIEVSIAAVVTQDSNLLRYVQDKSTDMHRDCACDLFFLKPEDVTKYWRYRAKNGFVFPEFYGDWWKSIGETLWKIILKEPEMREHLKNNGIRTERRFLSHVEDVENIFWKDRFYEYSQWKEEQWQRYELQGYIDVPTGFRYWGIMGKNEIINYQIQGPAFHVLLWSLIQIQKRIERKPHLHRSQINNEIHDQLLFDCHPDNEQEIDHMVWLWGTQRVREYWPWITIPLEIEKEKGGTDEPWSKLKECGYLTQK